MTIGYSLSIVYRQQLLQRTSPKLLAGFLPNLTGMILYGPLYGFDHIWVTQAKIDFRDENIKKSSCLKPEGQET